MTYTGRRPTLSDNSPKKCGSDPLQDDICGDREISVGSDKLSIEIVD
jgi:hypothetical protein